MWDIKNMTLIEPPHEITDRTKAANMIRAIRSGGTLPAVLVIGDIGLTGSHRIFACNATDTEVETVEVSDLDYRRACYALDIDTHTDCAELNLFIGALWAVTEDTEVKALADDQRHDEAPTDEERISAARQMTIEALEEYRGW